MNREFRRVDVFNFDATAKPFFVESAIHLILKPGGQSRFQFRVRSVNSVVNNNHELMINPHTMNICRYWSKRENECIKERIKTFPKRIVHIAQSIVQEQMTSQSCSVQRMIVPVNGII